MNAKQTILTAMLVDAIVTTVESAGETPEGPMYAAFMTQGCTLEQFQSFVNAACATGRIRKSGNLLIPVRSTESEMERARR